MKSGDKVVCFNSICSTSKIYTCDKVIFGYIGHLESSTADYAPIYVILKELASKIFKIEDVMLLTDYRKQKLNKLKKMI